MCARVIIVVVFFSLNFILTTSSVTVHRYRQPHIFCDTKIELSPLIVPCSPSDIIVISAANVENAEYYLFKPNGDAIKLDMNTCEFRTKPINLKVVNATKTDITRYTEKESMYPLNSYRIYSLDPRRFNYMDFFAKYSTIVEPDDFIIGPLVDDNHGNWVLSAYQQQKNGDCVETFQVITVAITEFIPANIRAAKLHEGDTLEISFAYPIGGLVSCELSAPESTYDRAYARDQAKMDSCGYIVRNLTADDTGEWRIIGVGRIVYRTHVLLDILEST